MTTERTGPTAQIIQFPARGRFTATSQNAHVAVMAEQVSDSAMCDSWYHDAAIRESKRAGER